ncbi:acyl carrier protein [Mesotoga sp. Brook.08.YT.4.2.5.1]|jgi:acyl carrier protein|uniref:Acyl carrier protein n=1 Tax=Mesotoga prima TaxID=1184387 RepID=A0A101HQL0_9BACT|nr:MULTISPECIES: acyl carrier protein [unclassified Mesotoga]KUK81143.1 MAG: Acyl carrier protein [Mesotoga prima]PNQ06058.1 acyl carrier protein [Mesotoga sp. SC_NapDC3]PXF35333.1 acyl carrier protein [Mesotoga sp. SC_NapDC]RAM58900.1 acyl carrier protein [Mesotoga sp. SC_4PWL113PWK15]RAM60748.1 acyl carrier protein [Mesotoga sp. SC_4PWA21]RAM62275.1 acyl carrier protein [Mesotoga sp. SC_3PWM13N19]RIZ61511.1 acyl carrier protein [Mesotoga sp. SC_NapDC2]
MEKTSTVQERVISIVAENLSIEAGEIVGSSRFIEDLGADSLDLVDLVMELEDKFDIQISDSQTASFKTIDDVVKFIIKLEER